MFSTMAAPVAHTIAGISPGATPAAAHIDPPDQAQSDNEPTAVQSVDRNDSQRQSTLLAF